MTALNPFPGSFYRETLAMSRMTREMFCLMEGRHVHPSRCTPAESARWPLSSYLPTTSFA